MLFCHNQSSKYNQSCDSAITIKKILKNTPMIRWNNPAITTPEKYKTGQVTWLKWHKICKSDVITPEKRKLAHGIVVMTPKKHESGPGNFARTTLGEKKNWFYHKDSWKTQNRSMQLPHDSWKTQNRSMQLHHGSWKTQNRSMQCCHNDSWKTQNRSMQLRHNDSWKTQNRTRWFCHDSWKTQNRSMQCCHNDTWKTQNRAMHCCHNDSWKTQNRSVQLHHDSWKTQNRSMQFCHNDSWKTRQATKAPEPHPT